MDHDDPDVPVAAVKGWVDPIVGPNIGPNVRDFPVDAPERGGTGAQHPDTFRADQFHLSQPALPEVVLRLNSPRMSVEDDRDILSGPELRTTVNEIKRLDRLFDNGYRQYGDLFAS